MKQTYFGAHVKFPMLLPDFNQIWNFWTYFHKVPNIKFNVSLSNDGGAEPWERRK
jgi:hypothetical protein